MKKNLENTSIKIGLKPTLYVASLISIGIFWLLIFIGKGYSQRLVTAENLGIKNQRLVTESRIERAILGEKIDTLVRGQEDMGENLEKIVGYLMENNKKTEK